MVLLDQRLIYQYHLDCYLPKVIEVKGPIPIAQLQMHHYLLEVFEIKRPIPKAHLQMHQYLHVKVLDLQQLGLYQHLMTCIPQLQTISEMICVKLYHFMQQIHHALTQRSAIL